jgi:hypothetical protein
VSDTAAAGAIGAAVGAAATREGSVGGGTVVAAALSERAEVHVGGTHISLRPGAARAVPFEDATAGAGSS